MKLKVSVSHETLGSAEAQQLKIQPRFLQNLAPNFSLSYHTKLHLLSAQAESFKIKSLKIMD